MEDAGVTLSLTAIGDVSMNPAGGLQRGRGFSGLLQLGADFDLEKLAGWTGGAIHAGAFVIGGRGLSGKFLGNLMPISNVESDPAERLAELYFMQTLFDGRLSFKIGQIAADGEFATSEDRGAVREFRLRLAGAQRHRPAGRRASLSGARARRPDRFQA